MGRGLREDLSERKEFKGNETDAKLLRIRNLRFAVSNPCLSHAQGRDFAYIFCPYRCGRVQNGLILSPFVE